MSQQRPLDRLLAESFPLPPAGEGRQRRIRAGVAHRVQRRARLRGLAAAVAALSATAAVATLLLRGPEGGRKTAEHAAASVEHPAAIADPVEAAPTAGAAGHPTETRWQKVELDDAMAVTVLVSEGGRVRPLSSDPSRAVARVDRGYALFQVEKRAPGDSFAVEVGPLTVRVVGTLFAAGWDRDRRPFVRVFEGTVAAHLDGGEVPIEAGAQFPADATSPIISRQTLARVARSTADSDIAPAPGPTPAEPPRRPRKNPFARARDLETAGDITAASALYRRLARRGGPRAGDALYALGRLALARGASADARRHFESYLQRHQGGAYEAAVYTHLLSLATQRGDRDEVQALGEAFASRYPRDPRARAFLRPPR